MKNLIKLSALLLLAAVLSTACGQAEQAHGVTYSLKTSLQGGKMVFIGTSGDIDGQVNPTLRADVGDVVSIELTSGEGAEHNIAIPDFSVESQHVIGQGKTIEVTFGVDKAGEFTYFDRMPGHQDAGMEGKLVVGGGPVSAPVAAVEPASVAPTEASVAMPGMNMQPAVVNTAPQAPATGEDIVRDPTDLPGPIGNRGPSNVRIDLEVKEITGQLADGTTFPYWTFNGRVPGPFFRVRVGDTVEVHLKNDPGSLMPHSVDFHAVTGPGGGAVMTTTPPGGETMFTFQPLNPGLYVYHCATPMVAMHIANGMYGLILVEPEGGLPPVDREFYVMQGEIYTTGKFGDKGAQSADVQKLLDEKPEYFVFNGAAGGLATQKPLKAKVGETIRVFFGVGGPNYTSSFHMIGEIFDRVYNLGSVTTPAMTDVQTTLVPPGGATIAEIKLQVPGKYILVDHALSRIQRGLGGWLVVEGPDAPEIFNGTPMPGSGH
ncbi:MAG: copper-containing nitrite reductase [Anaerolineae bacterium]